MSAKVPFPAIILNEKDVPGAQLVPDLIVEGHSSALLRRWLQCRKQPTEGKKNELVARVKMCIRSGTCVHPYIDNGKWLAMKEQNVRTRALRDKKITEFPVVWSKFPSQDIPENYNYGSIFNHLVSSCILTGDENDNFPDVSKENVTEDYSTAKPLKRGRQYFDSGHVTNMEDSVTNKEKHYCAKANVLASYKINLKYEVCIMLEKQRGDVLDAQCQCKASAMGRCSHVAALLYAVLDFIMILKSDKACTSTLCKWNRGRKIKLPVKVDENQYNKKVDSAKMKSFNPCPGESTQFSIAGVNLFIAKVQKEYEAWTPGTMWDMLLERDYEDYELDLSRKSDMLQMVRSLQNTLLFGAKGPLEMTDGLQGSSEKWKKVRQLLITASNIKTFTLSKTKQQLFNLVERHLWNAPTTIFSQSLDYGRINEEVAKKQYENVTKCMSFEIQDTGLWVNPKYPGLGASPDALIYDPVTKSSPFELLEIKCPKVLENLRPTEMYTLKKDQLARFCCTLEGEELVLKKNNDYYYQIQTQMIITERTWCDFMIWTPLDFHVQRINLDYAFAKKVTDAAMQFHRNILAPEYFAMRVPRELIPFDFSF